MNLAINLGESIREEKWSNSKELEKKIHLVLAKLSNSSLGVQDPLEEVTWGRTSDLRPTFISGLLKQSVKDDLIAYLQEYKGCFAWHYHEMSGLDRDLIEHKLPIKEGYKTMKQWPYRMPSEIELKVNEEIKRLLKASFIRPAKYVD